MMRLGRHPRAIEVAAWFDGEGRPSVGSHVARCDSCRRRVDGLAEVRSWVRSQPLYRMGDVIAVAPRRSRRPLALAVVAATIAAGIAIPRASTSRDDLAAPAEKRSGAAVATSLPAGLAPVPAIDDSAAINAIEHAPALAARPAAAVLAPPPPLAAAGRAGPLRLGLVVPQRGAAAAEGDEVERVVRDRVEVGNAEGGVAGFPIELFVAAAEDPRAVLALAERVDAMVGGFGTAAPADVTWLLPADPGVTGLDVLAPEASPAVAGAQLAVALRQSNIEGPVGVVVGTGYEAQFAEGLASKTPVLSVPARDATCATEVGLLQRARVEAMAVAGAPDLVATCITAAVRALWRPRLGVVVPPSTAYAANAPDPLLWGARTLLSMPWPSTSAPGATRFRTVTGASSYRSLVSFTAVELAIGVARRNGSITLTDIAARTWPSDILELSGTTSRGGAVAVAGPEAWTPER